MTEVVSDQDQETLRALDFAVTVFCSWVAAGTGIPCPAKASYLACCVTDRCSASSAVCEEHRVYLTLQTHQMRCNRCGVDGLPRDIVRWVNL